MPKEIRLCSKEGCENELGGLQNRGSMCRVCKEKDAFIKAEAGRAARLAYVHESDRVVLHSCVGPADPFPERCACRKYVSFDVAKEIVNKGEAIDWDTRAKFFFGKGRDILVSGRLKMVPKASVLGKVQIERGIRNVQRVNPSLSAAAREKIEVDRFNELQTKISEERDQRRAEQEIMVEVYHEIQVKELQSLVRLVPEEEYDRIERQQFRVPVLQGSGIGQDDRTAGCHDINGSWAAVEEDENDETDTTEDREIEEVEPEVSEDTDDADDSEDGDTEGVTDGDGYEQSGEELAAAGD